MSRSRDSEPLRSLATEVADSFDADPARNPSHAEVHPPGDLRRRIDEVRAIAGLETLDGVRDRRQILVRALTPVVLFLCVLGVSLGLSGTDSRSHPQPYTVAVEGDIGGAADTLAALSDRLEFIPVDDARLAAFDQTELGIRIPDAMDQTRRDDPGAVIAIEIFQVGIDPPSRAGSLLLQSSLANLEYESARLQLEEQRASTESGRGDSIAVTVLNVERSQAGTRTLVSQVIPGLLCLQAALLVAGTANRIVSRRSRGLLMAQLLLPVSRRALATAKGLGELVVGCVTASPVIAAVLGFGLLSAAFTGALSSTFVHLVAIVITMVGLFSFTTALGVVIGTSARTQEQVSLATGAAVIVASLIAVIVAIGDRSPPAIIAIVPVAGSVGSLRDVLEGSGSVLAVAIATVTTLAATLLVVVRTGRSLDAERMVLRNG